jgi:hypothetical protein
MFDYTLTMTVPLFRDAAKTCSDDTVVLFRNQNALELPIGALHLDCVGRDWVGGTVEDGTSVGLERLAGRLYFE